MTTPTSKADPHQRVLVSDYHSIRPLQKGGVWISHQSRSQSHHGVEMPASNQGLLRPSPWPGVRQLLPDGQHPGFPSFPPFSNTVPAPGSRRMSSPKQPYPASGVDHLILPDSYSGSDEEYGVDPFELAPLIPPDSEPSSDEEHGVDPPELRGVDNPHGRLPTSCELLGLDSLSSNKPPEVGSPPGKRPWPFAGGMLPDNLTRLNHSTLGMLQPPRPPQSPKISIVQTFDADAVRDRLLTSLNAQKSMPKAPALSERRRYRVDKPAMPRALSSEGPVALDPRAFVATVNGLALTKVQGTLRELAKKTSYEKMVEFAKTLTHTQTLTLLNQLWRWVTTPNQFERNPEAASLMALLLLFTTYTPSLNELDEFMKILPRTWPPALKHLRRECLDRRAILHFSAPRDAFRARLDERYGD